MEFASGGNSSFPVKLSSSPSPSSPPIFRDSPGFVLTFCGEVSEFTDDGDCIVARGTCKLDGVFANGDADADADGEDGVLCLDDVSKLASLWPVNDVVGCVVV